MAKVKKKSDMHRLDQRRVLQCTETSVHARILAVNCQFHFLRFVAARTIILIIFEDDSSTLNY